jgi:hypothetical protein
MDKSAAKRIEAVIVGCVVALIVLSILRIPAVQADDWYNDTIDFIAKSLTGFVLLLIVIYAVAEILMHEEKSPVNLLIKEEKKANRLSIEEGVLPFELIYKKVDEKDVDFLKRAIDRLKNAKCCIVVFYSEPYCIIKYSDGTTLRMMRGEAPWESGIVTTDLSQQTYADYMNYTNEFVNCFLTHTKRCAFESSEIDDIDVVVGKTLPSFMPKNFLSKKALSVFLVFALSVVMSHAQTAASQVYDMMRGGVREVPDKNSVVEFVFDNGAVVVKGDGRRTYEMLMNSVKRQLSRYNDNTLMGVFVDGKELVSRRVVNDIVNERQEAVRVKPVSSPQAQTQSVRPPVAAAPSTPPVDVRPGAERVEKIPPPPSEDNMPSPDKAIENIDKFKEEAVDIFDKYWRVVEYAFHAAGRFIIFLMILARMWASQAAGEMFATFAGRIWGGQFILNALVFLSAWQMVLFWLASGYLLTSIAIFLANANLHFFWWVASLFFFSYILAKASHWFVVSPRDVLDSSQGRGGGVIPRG